MYKDDIPYNNDIQKQFQELGNVLSSDIVRNPIPLASEQRLIQIASYLRYCGIAQTLNHLSNLLVSPETRPLLELLFLRILEIRLTLGQNSLDDGWLAEVRTEALRLELNSDVLNWEGVPSCLLDGRRPQYERLTYLLDKFCPKKGDLSGSQLAAKDTVTKSVPHRESPDKLFNSHLFTAEQQVAAVTKIASFFRMYLARKRYRGELQEKLGYYNLLPPESASVIAESSKIIAQRLSMQRQLYVARRVQEKSDMDAYVSSCLFELSNKWVPRVFTSLWEFKRLNHKYPDSVVELLELVEAGKSLQLVSEKKRRFGGVKRRAVKKKIGKSAPGPTTVDKLKTAIEGFIKCDERSWTFDLSSKKAQIFKELKNGIIKNTVDPEMAKFDIPPEVVEPVKANKPPPVQIASKPAVVVVPEVPYIEQDLIDLIKEGWVCEIDQKWVVCDPSLAATDSVEVFLSSLMLKKRLLFERCVLPLLLAATSSSLVDKSDLLSKNYFSQSVLLYGPEGGGKRNLVNAVARETHSTLIRITVDKLTAGKKQALEYFADKIVKVAKNNIPCVICIENFDVLYMTKKKVSKAASAGGGKNSATGGGSSTKKKNNPLAKFQPILPLLKERIVGLPILLAVTVSSPQADLIEEVVGDFDTVVPMLAVTHADRVVIIREMLIQAGISLDAVYRQSDALIETMAKETTRISLKALNSIVSNVFRNPSMVEYANMGRFQAILAEVANQLGTITSNNQANETDWKKFQQEVNDKRRELASMTKSKSKFRKK